MTPSRCFVVQGPDGQLLATFSERAAALRYAGGCLGRTVTEVPHVAGEITTTTVYTRWIEVDHDGAVLSDTRESYEWCSAIDAADGPPALAEVEHYTHSGRHTLLGLGTDETSLEDQLEAWLRPGALNAAS